MKLRNTLVNFLILLCATDVNAQQKFAGAKPGYWVPNPSAFVDVQSPTAASLGKYGEEDVSFFTGNPNISIPLYTLSVRDVQMPISLDYDAKGVMPNSIPSWAGQNWTLNVGGVITRTVKGRYDEWIYPKETEKLLFSNAGYNYFQRHDKLTEYLAEGGDYIKLKNNSEFHDYDLSPDEYTFHFMGKSGKFFLDQDGSWRVMSNDNLEVIFDYNNPSNFIGSLFERYPSKTTCSPEQTKTIAGFVIRDEDGNTYTFGYDKNAIDYTTNIWHMSENEYNETWHAASWYLTKVTDRFGNDLYKLSYERGVYVIQVFNSYYSDTVDEKAISLLVGIREFFSLTNWKFPYTISISSPVYLTGIEAMNGISVKISSSNVGKNLATETLYKSLYIDRGVHNLYLLLASMVNRWKYEAGMGNNPIGAFYYLQSNDNDSLKAWRYPSPDDMDILSRSRIRKLNYVSIESNKSAPNNYIGYRFCMSDKGNRLKLDSIMIQNDAIHYSSTTGIKGVYRFNYIQFDKLPCDYLTTSVDHWGYYNGRPYKTRNGSYAENMIATREPDFNYTQIGVLNEIMYPTGGVTVYEYEPNDYSLVLSNDRQSVSYKNGIGGGLRVKSIKTYDSPERGELLHQKDYSYIDPLTGSSSGELFASPLYDWNWKLKCVQSNATYKLRTLHSASVVPLANGSGISLAYSCVTEKIKDNANPNNTIEKHLYRYTNISDPAVRDERFILTFGYPDQHTPFDEWSELTFKKGLLTSEEVFDGNDNLITKTNYKYRTDNVLDKYVLTSNLEYECYGSSAQYRHYLGGIYKLYYPKYDLISKTELDYSSGPSNPMVTTYSYDKSDVSFTSFLPYRHEVDMRVLKSESITRGIFNESYTYTFGNFNAKSGTDSILYKAMSYIKPYKTRHVRNGQFISEKNIIYSNYTINGKNRLLPKMVTNRNSYNLVDTVLTYSSYTSTGMPLVFKEKGRPSTFLKWGYKDCYLVMSGNAYIPFNIDESIFFNQKKCLDHLKSSIKNFTSGQITGYVWNPLFGVSAIILPNGNVTTYTYNKFGQLTNIYDCNNVLTNEYEYNLRK